MIHATFYTSASRVFAAASLMLFICILRINTERYISVSMAVAFAAATACALVLSATDRYFTKSMSSLLVFLLSCVIAMFIPTLWLAVTRF